MIERVVELLAAHYVFPEVGAELGGLLTDRLAAGCYDNVGDESSLAGLVTVDLQSINEDKHLRLLHSDDEVADESDADGQMAAFTQYAELNCGGVARVQRLDGNIGYVELRPILFPPSIVGDVVAGAMTLIASTDALLIDVRQCLGGDPSMVAFLCSYLFGDEPVHLIDIFERADDRTKQCWTLPYVPGRRFGPTKPVYLLTSGTTFSGAEDLCFDLQELRRATVVGERTGGGAHPREGFRVHPHLEATIPIARAISPRSGTNWESTGVIPDIEVTADQAFDVAVRLASDASNPCAARDSNPEPAD